MSFVLLRLSAGGRTDDTDRRGSCRRCSGRCDSAADRAVIWKWIYQSQENNALLKMCVTEFLYKMRDPTCRNSHCSILLITDRWHDLSYGHWTQHSCRRGSFTLCESTCVWDRDYSSARCRNKKWQVPDVIWVFSWLHNARESTQPQRAHLSNFLSHWSSRSSVICSSSFFDLFVKQNFVNYSTNKTEGPAQIKNTAQVTQFAFLASFSLI